MAGTPLLPKFRYRDADTSDGLALTYADDAAGLTLTFLLRPDPSTRIITAKTILDARDPVHLHWLAAPVLPAPQQSAEMIDVSGRWCGEFQLNRTAWSPGIRYRENRTGRTGHEHFPGLLIPCFGATNTQGEAYGFHYGWSGGHRMVAEELPDGRRQVQWGHSARMETQAATRFESATLYVTYSQYGLNGCAVAFQRHLRDRIVTWPKPATPPPGPLQLLGGRLLRPQPPRPPRHRHPRGAPRCRALRARRWLVRQSRRRHAVALGLGGRSAQIPRRSRPPDRPCPTRRA